MQEDKALPRGGWGGGGAGALSARPRSPQTAPGSQKRRPHQPALGRELIPPVSPHPRSVPRCTALCIHLSAVEDFSALVVTLHCFWAAFPLISFSSEILSSPSLELMGPFISKVVASRRAADS